MRFMYLVATVTVQGLAVAQEQEGRMLIKRPFSQQGNLFKTWQTNYKSSKHYLLNRKFF